MRANASDWFASKGFPVSTKYRYCLDEWDNWPKNIILPEVVDYINACRAERVDGRPRLRLHKYIHHGLSSQALLFNLVGPLIVRRDIEPLANALRAVEISWPKGWPSLHFEYEDRSVLNEDVGQPTSIDLAVLSRGEAPPLFIECKLVEAEFGACSIFRRGDCDGLNPAGNPERCYLHHIGRKYWTLLDELGFLNGKLATDSTCILAAHYQFFREVLFATARGGSLVLLSDDRSPVFFCDGAGGREARGRMKLLNSLVPEHMSGSVRHLSIQYVVSAIEKSGRHPWIAEFKAKYGFGA